MTTPGWKTSHTGIRRLGEKKFHLRVTMRHPTTKKKIEKETVVDGVTIREAERRWEQLRDELLAAAAADAVMPDRTRCDEKLEPYMRRWIEHAVRTGKVRPHVLNRMTDALERFVVPFLGELTLSEVNPVTLTRWAEKLGGLRREDGEPYASATLHTAWATLRAVLNDARMVVGFKVDVDGFEFPTKGKPAKPKDVLTREEVIAVLDAARPETFDVACMIWMGFTTGMRFCELSSLQWEDVDLVAGTARIVRSQVYGTVGRVNLPVSGLLAASLEVNADGPHEAADEDHCSNPRRGGRGASVQGRSRGGHA